VVQNDVCLHVFRDMQIVMQNNVWFSSCSLVREQSHAAFVVGLEVSWKPSSFACDLQHY